MHSQVDRTVSPHPALARRRIQAGSAGLKVLLLFVLLYAFIVSIQLLGSSFKLFGKEFAESILRATDDPLIGVLIGVLATSIMQSSSTTTSIIVGLVASGVLTFENSIPIVMGANIGTTITNTLVSLAHITRSDEFRRAFAGSVVHDFFNICSVVVLLPLQIEFNLVGGCANLLERVFEGWGGLTTGSPLAAVTKPVAGAIIDATGKNPILCVIIALVLLFLALRYIVKVLRSLVLSRVEGFFQRYIFRTPALGFVLGLMLTIAVQSSSITTSIVVPLIGAGVISLHQVYPYFLGANVGTTVTAFLAALATGSPDALRVSFAHFSFNVLGTMVFWPLQRIPIWLATRLARATQKSRLVPAVYILVAFFLVPALIIYLRG